MPAGRTSVLPIWRSIAQSYGILFRNLPAVIAIYAPMLIGFLPLGLAEIWVPLDSVGIGETVILLSLAVATLGSFTGAAALQYAALGYLRDGIFAAGASYRLAMRRFFPLIGLMLIIAIGSIVTLGLFVVPFLILAPIYCLTTIAFIGEGRGIFASFARSAELTAGHRWRLLGIHALAVLIGFAVSLLLGIPKIIFGALGFVLGEAAFELLSIFFAATAPLILTSVLYHTLCNPSAGLAPGRHNPVL